MSHEHTFSPRADSIDWNESRGKIEVRRPCEGSKRSHTNIFPSGRQSFNESPCDEAKVESYEVSSVVDRHEHHDRPEGANCVIVSERKGAPDYAVSETSSYAQDIVLGLENLLALRALYKTLLEGVRSNILEIPDSASNKGGDRLGNDELETIQSQLSLLSYRFSRTVFPSDIRFYTQSPHANKVIEHLEEEMQLPELGTALETEMEKLQGTIDSFGTLVTHNRNLSLQRRILIYTIVVGLVGAGVTLLTIFL